MTITQEQVNQARKEAETAYSKFSIIKCAYLKAEKEYLHKLNQFKDMDYKLAEVDGRLKKITSSTARKEKSLPTLSIDQLKAIAEKLGFDLTTVIETNEEAIEQEEVIEDDSQV